MFSLLKVIQNRYVSIILILILYYVLSHTTFHFLSNVNFSIILYVLIASKINEETYLPYSIIFGLYSDYAAGSYIGLNVLFFLFLSLIKMFTEYKFDLKTSFSLVIFMNHGLYLFLYFFLSYTKCFVLCAPNSKYGHVSSGFGLRFLPSFIGTPHVQCPA